MDVPVRDWVSTSAGQPTRILGFDLTLVWVVVALLSLGLLMVYSASIALPDSPRFARYSPMHFFSRQCIYIATGLVAGLITVQLPVAFWERHAPKLFVVALLLLVVVLIPHVEIGRAHV